MFGLSGKDLPPVTKYIYLALLFILMGAGLMYGFSQIGNKPEKQSNKRRKKSWLKSNKRKKNHDWSRIKEKNHD